MTNSQIGRLDGLISTNEQGRSSHEGATDSYVNIRKEPFLGSCVLVGSFASEHGGGWAENIEFGPYCLSTETHPRKTPKRPPNVPASVRWQAGELLFQSASPAQPMETLFEICNAEVEMGLAQHNQQSWRFSSKRSAQKRHTGHMLNQTPHYLHHENLAEAVSCSVVKLPPYWPDRQLGCLHTSNDPRNLTDCLVGHPLQ